MSKSNLVNDLVADIKRIATDLSVKPELLSKTQFLANSKFKEWDLRKVGGYGSVIKTYFPFPDKNLVAIAKDKQVSSYFSDLEKQLGTTNLKIQNFAEEIGKMVSKELLISPIVFNRKETLAYLKKIATPPTDGNTKARRSVCTLWSDQHFGMNFSKEHTKGLNAYNWDIAARRFAMLLFQIATFKIERRLLHDELVIFLMGDNIAGVIHDQEGKFISLSAEQVHGTAGYYIQGITYLLNFFPKIRIECQTGNHGRVMHKASKDRAMIAKFDSFETMITSAIQFAFMNEPRVQINVPQAPYSDVTVQGHRIYATHGDTVFTVGNPGKAIPMGKLEHQVNGVNANLPFGEPRYEMFVSGHVHHHLDTHVGNVDVIVNGSMVGTDPFAQGVSIHDNNPTQALWETTQADVLGDLRKIKVVRADTATPELIKMYSSIITPYKPEDDKFFVWWDVKRKVLVSPL